MGRCVYCGERAGFWKSQHQTCAEESARREQLFSSVLDELRQSRVPTVNVEGLPVNLRIDERPVWAFTGVAEIGEERRRRSRTRSSGVSVRIISGVTYRTGEAESGSRTDTATAVIDGGVILVTTRNVYFIGIKDSDRVPIRDLITYFATGSVAHLDTDHRRFSYHFAEAERLISLVQALLGVSENALFAATLRRGTPEMPNPPSS